MRETIATLLAYDIDVIKRKGDYLAVFRGGAMISLQPAGLKKLAHDAYQAIKWHGKTIEQFRDETMAIKYDVMMRTLY